MKRFKLTMKQEVFYFGLFLIFIILVMMITILSIGFYTDGIDDAMSHLKSDNDQIIASTNHYFHSLTMTLEILTQDELIIQNKRENYDKIRNRFRELEQSSLDIYWIYLGYTDGTLIVNNWVTPEGYNLLERPWYIAAIEAAPEASVGLPYKDLITNELLISQSKVIVDQQDEVQGVLSVDGNLETFSTLFSEVNIYPSQQSFIVNEQGEIILHLDEELIGTVYPELGHMKDTSDELDVKFEGEDVIGYYSKILDGDWVIVTIVNESDIRRPIITKIIHYLGVAAVLSFLIGIIQVLIFNKRFIEPITSLSVHIKQIIEGAEVNRDKPLKCSYELKNIFNDIEGLTSVSMKRKHDELLAIIESSSEGIVVVDEQGKIKYLNSQFIEMFDLMTKPEKSLGDQELIQMLKDTLIAESQKVFCLMNHTKTEYIHLKNGNVYEQHGRSLLESEQIIGYLWNYRDVTENQKVVTELSEMALTDELTGLLNRRGYKEKAEKAISYSKVHLTDLTMLMLDIDHFKMVNDTYGHIVGDFVLINLAKIMKKRFRKEDILVRAGGEEFILLLQNTSEQDAYKLAEKLRVNVQEQVFDIEGYLIQFTVSIGIATCEAGVDLAELTSRADTACYLAKEHGRNRTEIYKKIIN